MSCETVVRSVVIDDKSAESMKGAGFWTYFAARLVKKDIARWLKFEMKITK